MSKARHSKKNIERRANARKANREAPKKRRSSVRIKRRNGKETTLARIILTLVLLFLIIFNVWWIAFNGVGKVGGLIDTDGDGELFDPDDKIHFVQDNIEAAQAIASGTGNQDDEMPYKDLIAAMASKYSVDPYFVAAIMDTESGFDPNAQSDSGASGLMQVTPVAAQEMINQDLVDGSQYSAGNLLDPETNIAYGTALLSWNLQTYGGSEEIAAAAYNAGQGNADRWVAAAGGGDITDVIDLSETADYVQKVQQNKADLQEEYPDAFD